MKKLEALIYGAFALACAALAGVSVGTPGWVSITLDEATSSTCGLFQCCFQGHCISYATFKKLPIPAYFKVTEAFLIMGSIFLLICSVYCVIVAVREINAKGILVLFAVAALFLLVGMSLFTQKQNIIQKPEENWDYSFKIGWTAFGLDAAVTFVLIKLGTESDPVYSAM